MSTIKRRFSIGEEIANTVSHGLGAAFAIIGLVLLIVFSAKYGTARHVVSFSIFGATLVLLYLSSTINHALKHGRAKDLFHNIDQIAIFLLIAGTYTPISLIVLKGDWGWTMFGLQWGFAFAGILAKLFVPNKYENGVNLFYISSFIIMGWMLLFFLAPLFRNMPAQGMIWIFMGGAFYTLGTIFYRLRKVPYAHLIWHIFVIAGSVCHWVVMMMFVLNVNN